MRGQCLVPVQSGYKKNTMGDNNIGPIGGASSNHPATVADFSQRKAQLQRDLARGTMTSPEYFKQINDLMKEMCATTGSSCEGEIRYTRISDAPAVNPENEMTLFMAKREKVLATTNTQERLKGLMQLKSDATLLSCNVKDRIKGVEQRQFQLLRDSETEALPPERLTAIKYEEEGLAKEARALPFLAMKVEDFMDDIEDKILSTTLALSIQREIAKSRPALNVP